MEIKPCPMCGSPAEAETRDYIHIQFAFVQCQNPSCRWRLCIDRHNGIVCDMKKEAIEAWNRRAD